MSLKDQRITEFSVPSSCLVAGVFSMVARDRARVFVLLCHMTVFRIMLCYIICHSCVVYLIVRMIVI